MTTNQTIYCVSRELLENLLYCGDTASTITPFVTDRLREILAAGARSAIDQGERALFDKWLRSRPHVLNVGFNRATGKYILQEDEDSWQVWQARARHAEQPAPVATKLDYVHDGGNDQKGDAARSIDGYRSAGDGGGELVLIDYSALDPVERLAVCRGEHPTKVVIPEKIQDPGMVAGLSSRYAQGWNACLDEVSRMNGLKP